MIAVYNFCDSPDPRNGTTIPATVLSREKFGGECRGRTTASRNRHVVPDGRRKTKFPTRTIGDTSEGGNTSTRTIKPLPVEASERPPKEVHNTQHELCLFATQTKRLPNPETKKDRSDLSLRNEFVQLCCRAPPVT